MSTPHRVGTRELKNKLSEYLRRVKAGETIIVTEHGQPIGQILPLAAGLPERMQRLVAAGLGEWDGNTLPDYRPRATNQGPGSLADLILEDRE